MFFFSELFVAFFQENSELVRLLEEREYVPEITDFLHHIHLLCF